MFKRRLIKTRLFQCLFLHYFYLINVQHIIASNTNQCLLHHIRCNAETLQLWCLIYSHLNVGFSVSSILKENKFARVHPASKQQSQDLKLGQIILVDAQTTTVNKRWVRGPLRMEQEESRSDLYNVILLFYLKCTFVEYQVAVLKYEYSQIIAIFLPEICTKIWFA